MQEQAAEDGNKPFLTLDQWKRHAGGEDIRAEIPPGKLAEFDEWERKADERMREAERIYLSHQPDLPTEL